MLKLAQIILTKLSKQMITHTVMPADCGEKKPLACRGKELARGDDSWVKESVIFSRSSAMGSHCPMYIGCLLRRRPHVRSPAGEDALPVLPSTTVPCARKFSSFLVLTVVFQRCLKSSPLHAHLKKKEKIKPPKHNKKNFYRKKVWQTVIFFPHHPCTHIVACTCFFIVYRQLSKT